LAQDHSASSLDQPVQLDQEAPSMARIARACMLLSLGSCAVAYKMIANCVPGPMMEIVGRPALYTIVLKTLMPTIYGDMKLMAFGEHDPCFEAANSINDNSVLIGDVIDKYGMQNLGVIKATGTYDNKSFYLYVFENEEFEDHEYIADCVPGDIVSTLSFTEGKIALYTVALQTILPSLFGDLKFLGTGPNADCMSGMNAINGGNESIVQMMKDKESGLDITQVGILKGMQVADNTSSYLYVFANKMWNTTWNVMDGRRLLHA